MPGPTGANSLSPRRPRPPHRCGARDRLLTDATAVCPPTPPPPLILVGTHHKTGSKWMRSLFDGFCSAVGERMHAGRQEDLPADARVWFEDHSRFALDRLGRPFRGLHVVRDPRDVLISGARYHARADEPWLLVRRWRFRGLTYREAIRRRKSFADAVLFEMDHAGGETIRDMLAWNRTHPDFLEVRYEDLVEDDDLALFRRILRFLGFAAAELPILEPIVRERSLFGGRVHDPAHVSDGRAGQWREVFDDRLHRAFADRFGDALGRLGYGSQGDRHDA